MGAGDGRAGILVQRDPRALRGRELELGQVVEREGVARRRGDGDVGAGASAESGERAGDVVAVADVGETQTVERAEGLLDGQQVGERLAGVVQRGEHVEDGDRGVRGELLEHRVGSGADAERGDVAGEDVGGVAQRLAAGELQVVGAQHQRVAAELVDAGLEGEPGARRGVLEEQRDAAPGERARGERRGLQLGARGRAARASSAALSSVPVR